MERKNGRFARKAMTPQQKLDMMYGAQEKSRVKNNPWRYQKQQYDDFASHFLPTDDIWASSGTGVDTVPSLQYFSWLAEKRIGVAYKIARKPAEDAVRNRFTIRDFKGDEVDDDDILDWMEDTDLYNQLVEAFYYERVYGCSFMMKYFSESDKDKDDLSKPAPSNKRPVAFQAFPPTHMSPVNVHQTNWLGTNPQKWDLIGGDYNIGKIHHSRVHVFMSRRVPDRWRGLSVFEPIWIPLMSYFQAMIFMLRAFSEMGNVIPVWLIDDLGEDALDLWTQYSSLLDEMKMNGKFVGKKGDEFTFPTTNIGQGLPDLMEMWKEDISAGTNLPLPILFGRVTAAGLSGAAYLMAERYYWNEIANIQASFSDDIIRIIRDAGFKTIDRKKRIDWNLAITKTDQQRLLDEGMMLQNEILKEDLLQRRLQTSVMAEQYKNGTLGQEPEQGNEEEKEDIVGQSSYMCSKCKKRHNKGSKLYNEHKKYATNSSLSKERDFIIEAIINSRAELTKELWGARKVA